MLKKIKWREEAPSKVPIAMEDFLIVDVSLSGEEAIRTQSFRECNSLRACLAVWEAESQAGPQHKQPAEREAERPTRPLSSLGNGPQKAKATSAPAEGTQVEFLPLKAHPKCFRMVTGRGSYGPDVAAGCGLVGCGAQRSLSMSVCSWRGERLPDSLHLPLWLTSGTCTHSPPFGGLGRRICSF